MKNFQKPGNCDPVLLCTSTDMETIELGVWCLFVNFSRHGQCGRKRKKTSRFCVIEKEYSNKLSKMGCFPIKPVHITKTIIWPILAPLAYTNLVP